MKTFTIAASLVVQALTVLSLPTAQQIGKRDAGFDNGQPIDGNGKGAPLLGMSTHFSTSFLNLALTMSQQVEQTINLTFRTPITWDDSRQITELSLT